MKRLLIFVLLACGLASSQTSFISAGPQTNYANVIQITNNTHPADTAPSPATGTYGKFVQQYYVYSGPCILTGAIRAIAITSGHTGTGYVTGDTGTVNGGSPLATYRVVASGGAVTGIVLTQPPFSAPYGSGYTVVNGVATTATSGVGTGLEVNVTGIYSGTAGPNCAVVEEMNKTAAYASACNNVACSNGDSITFAHVYPAGTGIDGTYDTDYQARYHVYTFTIATAGSGQTGGAYFLNATGGGGGSGNQIAANIPTTGTNAGKVTQISSVWFGSGYTSCPSLTISAGGTPATFNCLDSAYPSLTYDVSLSPGTYYYQLATGNVSGGMATDNSGNIWALYADSYVQQVNQGPSYIAIRKSTDGGHTFGNEYPLLYDNFPRTFPSPGHYHCGPGGNTIGCSYVTGSVAMAPDGHTLVVGYWWEDPTATYFVNFGGATNCCFVIRCDTAAVDCTQVANWGSPYQIPVTVPPLLSPKGTAFTYDYAMGSSYNNKMPAGEMGMGIVDAQTFYWISVSCDNGATWSTGTGCVGGTNTLVQVCDNTAPQYCNGYLETDFGYYGGNNWIFIARNNIAAYSGGVPTCFYPQVNCGPIIFGYSTDNGTTWHIRQSSLGVQCVSSITSGEFGMTGPYMVNTNTNGLWTIMWLERDQTPAANLCVVASTIQPSQLISNLSSWTNSQLQTLWRYSINPIPSSVYATITGPGTIAYQWTANPGANELEGFWWSYGTYTFTPPLLRVVKHCAVNPCCPCSIDTDMTVDQKPVNSSIYQHENATKPR